MARAAAKTTKKSGEKPKPGETLVAPVKFDYVEYLLREARLGNTAPLAGYVRFCAGRRPLTPELSEYIAELLERFERKRGKDALRRVEKELIRQQVQGFENEGLSRKAAISEVERWRGVGRSKVYAALRESKKQK